MATEQEESFAAKRAEADTTTGAYAAAATVTDDATDADWQSKRSLKECHQYMLDHDIYADVTFKVSSQDEPQKEAVHVQANKVLLSVRSSVFQNMFFGALAETGEVINIPDVEPEAFCQLIRYIYTDDVKLTSDNMFAVLYAAKKYMVFRLKQRCLQFIESELRPANAVTVLQHGTFFDEEPLKETGLRMIQKRTKEVFEADDFLHTPDATMEQILRSDALAVQEIDVFRACMAWATAKNQKKKPTDTARSLKAALGNLLYLIRFPTMSQLEFAQEVVPSGLLTDGESLSVFMSTTGDDKSCAFSTVRRYTPSTIGTTASQSGFGNTSSPLFSPNTGSLFGSRSNNH